MLKQGYYALGRAYPEQMKAGVTGEFSVGMFDTDGGCEFEFIIETVDLCGKATVVVHVYDDAFQAFTKFPDLFRYLSDGFIGDPTPEAVEELLRDSGFEDLTKMPPTMVRHCHVCGQSLADRPSADIGKSGD